jgi:hypothetical protein
MKLICWHILVSVMVMYLIYSLLGSQKYLHMCCILTDVQLSSCNVRFKVFRVVLLEIEVFWDIAAFWHSTTSQKMQVFNSQHHFHLLLTLFCNWAPQNFFFDPKFYCRNFCSEMSVHCTEVTISIDSLLYYTLWWTTRIWRLLQ